MRTTKQVARWSSPEPPPPMTLPPPNPALRVCVVVTTRNEEELIGSCLRALAEQEGVSYDTVRDTSRPRPLHRRHPGARQRGRRILPCPPTLLFGRPEKRTRPRPACGNGERL